MFRMLCEYRFRDKKSVRKLDAEFFRLCVGGCTCLTAMLTRTELMEPSIRTFSLSLRLITTGCSSSSLLLL